MRSRLSLSSKLPSNHKTTNQPGKVLCGVTSSRYLAPYRPNSPAEAAVPFTQKTIMCLSPGSTSTKILSSTNTRSPIGLRFLVPNQYSLSCLPGRSLYPDQLHFVIGNVSSPQMQYTYSLVPWAQKHNNARTSAFILEAECFGVARNAHQFLNFPLPRTRIRPATPPRCPYRVCLGS